MRHTLAALFLIAPPLCAQMQMPMDVPLTAHAKEQIAEARRVASALDTPEKARAAGYRRRFGDVPLQGEHWSNPALVLSGTFDLEHPPILMFAPVKGVRTLIGVAYAYELNEGAAPPDAFDGAAMWHQHALLSLPGKRLTMTHVWFMDSPFGPFAHDNPTLSFVERDIPQPPAGWLAPPALHDLALALAVARWQLPGLAAGQRVGVIDSSAISLLASQRDSVDAMVPRLQSAQAAGNAAAYRTAAGEISAWSPKLLKTIKSIPLDPMSRILVGALIDETLGEGHAHTL